VSRPGQFDNWPATLPVPWGPYRAAVGKVYDGDTCSVWVSMGLDQYAWIDVRLADVHAPEMTSSDPAVKKAAIESRDYLYRLTVNYRIRLRTEKLEGASEVKSFERYVGWLTRDDGLDVNAQMASWLDLMGYTGGM
jgi:endonuclease YncB( thermonuclease family)